MYCVIETEVILVRWSTFQLRHFDSLDEGVRILWSDDYKDTWWCWFCARPLFVPPWCVLVIQPSLE
jgi:hypothetical protein